jgi:predicted regulator of Ras-like GTPase activity (Roadblock/LC7/MglB family)
MFRTILGSLTARVEGARWAMVAGSNGGLVESSPQGFDDAEVIAAEYALLYRAMRRTVAAQGDELTSATITTDRGKMLFHFLTPDYFLVMALHPASHSGKAAFEVSRARGSLERELVC